MPSNTPPTVWRKPRLREQVAEEQIDVHKPPPMPRAASPILRSLLPALISVSVMAMMASFGNSTRANALAYSAPLMLASSAVALIFYFVDRRSFRSAMAKRETDYNEYLARLNEDLAKRLATRSRILVNEFPDPGVCEQMVNPERHEMFQQLWSKRPEDDDFLVLRVGLGKRPSGLDIHLPEQPNPFDKDPLIEQAASIAQDRSLLVNIPLTVDLREVGSMGVAGPCTQRLRLVRALIMHLSTHHAPDEVKLGAIHAPDQTEEWAWMRWLPHTWSMTKKRRYIACNAKSAADLLHHYVEIMEQRERQLEELSRSDQEEARFDTHHVVLLAAPELTSSSPYFARLVSDGPRVGIYTILVRSSFDELMNSCQYGVRVGQQGEEGEFGPMAGHRQGFAPDHCSSARAERFALAMAPLQPISQATVAAIPTYVPLLDVLGAQDVEDLHIGKRWEASRGANRSLAAPIGRREGNQPLMFDLHERAHGPNGLVAGMVGAGKSELLQSVVASIATNYHPHQVSFVIIDYKGGGMATPFEGMPHTLGTIDNLQDESMARRAVQSLKVELDRRLQLFQDAGVNHINKYQQLYTQGAVKTAIPYLVVIVDEFAELKTEHPEVALEFVRIARLGRAPGLCLILAMQKPSGIVDGQIEGNTRFRLCLRVAQKEDSSAMLDRPEAAFLTGIGRAYFQVGVNEQFSLFQVAYAGAPYLETSENDDTDLEIRRVRLDGHMDVVEPPNAAESAAAPAETTTGITQLQAVVTAIIKAARAEDIKPLPSPWLDPLPDSVTLDALLNQEAWQASRLETVTLGRESMRSRLLEPGGWDGASWQPTQGWMDPIIGLVDDPRQQAQYPQEVDLDTHGHLVIYGADTSDTTVAIQTLFCSLARTWSPADVHMYAIDYANQLGPMEQLPHVGAVVREDQEERMTRLLNLISSEIDRRRTLFAQAGATSLSAYREGTGDPIPAIVLAMNNFGAFYTQHTKSQQDPFLPQVLRIGREGADLGIHMVATAMDKGSMGYSSIRNLFGLQLILRLNSPEEIEKLVGRLKDIELDDEVAMRGIICTDPIRLVQVALPVKGESEVPRSHEMNYLFQAMDVAWQGARPQAIPATPEIAYLSEAIETPPNATAAPVGLDLADLSSFYWKPGAYPLTAVLGTPRSGKTNLLRTLLLGMGGMAAEYAPKVYIIDSTHGGLTRFTSMPCVAEYASDASGANQLVAKLKQAIADARAGDPPIVLVMDDAYSEDRDVTSTNLKKTALPALLRARCATSFSIVISASYGDIASGSTGARNLDPLTSAAGRFNGALLGQFREGVFLDVTNLVRATIPMGNRTAPLAEGRGYWSDGGQGRAALFYRANTTFRREVPS